MQRRVLVVARLFPQWDDDALANPFLQWSTRIPTVCMVVFVTGHTVIKCTATVRTKLQAFTPASHQLKTLKRSNDMMIVVREQMSSDHRDSSGGVDGLLAANASAKAAVAVLGEAYRIRAPEDGDLRGSREGAAGKAEPDKECGSSCAIYDGFRTASWTVTSGC